MDESNMESVKEAARREVYAEINLLKWRKKKLVKEEAALGVLYGKLRGFMETAYFRALPEDEKDLLQRQRTHMAGYRSALNGRIELLRRRLP